MISAKDRLSSSEEVMLFSLFVVRFKSAVQLTYCYTMLNSCPTLWKSRIKQSSNQSRS